MPLPITTDLSSAVNESKSPLPYSSGGVTAEQVVANSPTPTTRAAFTARGGISNTINQMRNNAEKEKRQAAIQQGYEKLLQGGDRAAQAVYDAYSEKIKAEGGDPAEYLPPKDLFYDTQTGYFLPHKFYESIYVGAKKFQDEKSAKDKIAADDAEKQSKIDANKEFGAEISNNPNMTKQEGMASALQKGTVTSEMVTAAGSLKDPTKITAKKLDLDWAKLRRQQNQDRLREMQIVLSQTQNRSEANRKAGESIASAQKDLREAQERMRNLNTLYKKAARGEVVRMDIEGTEQKLSSDELNEMIHNAEMLENDIKSTIDEMEARRKSNVLSPAAGNLNDAANKLTSPYEKPEDTQTTSPASQTRVVKPTLTVSPKPITQRGGGF